MDNTGYERYGLSCNPFRYISSENLENIDIFHVTQSIDKEINLIKEEVFSKENRAVVAILGGLGAGKTERLLLAANEARRNNLLYIFQNVTMETHWAIEGVLESIIENAGVGLFARIFRAPIWYRSIIRVKKSVRKGYDPDKVGHLIAEVLNEKAPSLILINDLHNLSNSEDVNQFLQFLHILIDFISSGVLIMISCDNIYFDELMKEHPSLNERINRKIVVPPLSNNEACLMIAKRLLGKRIVDGIDPLYPFTEEAIGILNAEAEGNPRRLLKIADIVIDQAARRRTIQIDGKNVRQILEGTKHRRLLLEFEEQHESLDIDNRIREKTQKDEYSRLVKKA